MKNRSIAISVNYAHATWQQVFWAALGFALYPVLMPVLAIISRIRRRPINFGVVEMKPYDVR